MSKPVLMRGHLAADALAAPVAVKEPIGDVIAHTRTARLVGEPGVTSAGMWECSPGKWRRQLVQSEFCVFLEGELSFHADSGDVLHIQAGDAAYFPANCTGVWDIKTTARKFYVLFNSADVS